MQQDHRLEAIKLWLPTVLNLTSSFSIQPASSDASFRRYFRILDATSSWIVMDAPPQHEDLTSFISIANFLENNHIHVPKIHASNLKEGFLLLSDLGSTPYLTQLNATSSDSMYRSAIDSLINIQKCSLNEHIQLPLYDYHLLKKELLIFPEWYLIKHLDINPPDFLEQTFDTLINNALEQPQTLVHRDFHSRNLMVTQAQSPGIIDFQDAVIGPVSYDLVSLLRDCYIAWPQDKINEWIDYYLTNAQQAGLFENVSFSQFLRWFDLTGLQRHLKVLGIFCRLNYRDNKPNYLADLPLTLDYVMQVSKKYPELMDLTTFLQKAYRSTE
jgi:aminoglycoside/choline kinase family phosphotransferase